MRFAAKHLLLYAVTDRSGADGQDFFRQVEDALRGGVTCVQLREKGMERALLIKEAERLLELCHRYHVPLLVNDDVSAALESGADGVHVGQSDMSVSEIRNMAGTGFIIGATAKTVWQAKQAKAQGADYIGVGAVFPSPTKADAIRITKGQLREICEAANLPAVAIGGICLSNASGLCGCGIKGIAASSAIFAADDICLAAAKLKAAAYAAVQG